MQFSGFRTIKKHNKYIGTRVKRDLFRGSTYLLNADVNSSLNVLRKVIGNDFIRDLVDRGLLVSAHTNKESVSILTYREIVSTFV